MKRPLLALLLLWAGFLAACGRVERKVRIVTLTELTGPQAAFGVGIRRAAALALAERRDALLAAGWNVELAAFDANSSPPELESTIRRIAADADTVCAVVHTDTPGNLLASGIFHSAGMGHVLPAETASLPDAASQPETFFLSPDDRSHGISDAEWSASRGYTRILLTADSNAHALSIGAGFRERAEALGSTVYTFRILSDGDFNDWPASFASIRPDLVYFSGSSQYIPRLLSWISTSGLSIPFFMAQSTPEDLPPQDPISDTLAIIFSPATTDSKGLLGMRPAMEDYRAAYGANPPALAALGYDGAAICAAPLLEKNAWNLGSSSARAQVVAAWRSGGVYHGITGSYPFGGKRPCRIPIFFRAGNPEAEWTPRVAPEPNGGALFDC
jgi:ABC-type branched-subunit amino acid transport system substrate-binding protein